VDDDPKVRDSLNDVLVSEGYVVIPAENGQVALDLATRSSVDLVLLDLNMPVKNGWDTFEHLHVGQAQRLALIRPRISLRRLLPESCLCFLIHRMSNQSSSERS